MIRKVVNYFHGAMILFFSLETRILFLSNEDNGTPTINFVENHGHQTSISQVSRCGWDTPSIYVSVGFERLKITWLSTMKVTN